VKLTGVKILSVLAILLIQSYATLELSRVVWLYWQQYGGVKFVGEIVVVLSCYLLLIPFLFWRLKE